MIGIPRQTPQSVMETVGYCDRLLAMASQTGHAGKVHPYVSPLAPFLDPGSKAFEHPERYGYRLLHKTLEEHRMALLQRSWKHTLNYETTWMSRDELVDVTYEAALGVNRLKLAYGLLRRKEANRIAERIARERGLINEIDRMPALADEQTREEEVRTLMLKFDAIGPSTICKKDEMNWPAGLIRFNPFVLIREAFAWIRGRISVGK